MQKYASHFAKSLQKYNPRGLEPYCTPFNFNGST